MRENLSHVYQEQAERFFVSQVDSYAIMQLIPARSRLLNRFLLCVCWKSMG